MPAMFMYVLIFCTGELLYNGNVYTLNVMSLVPRQVFSHFGRPDLK